MDAPTPNSPWGTSPYQQAVATGIQKSTLHWIIAALSAVVVLGGAAAYYFLVYRAPVALPLQVLVEAPALSPGSIRTLSVSVTNPTREPALATEVAVTLPDRTSASGLEYESVSSTASVPVLALGDIAAGETVSVRLNLDTELDPASAVPLTVETTYATTKDPAKRFSISQVTDLVIEQAAVSLTMTAPKGITRDEAFPVTIRYRNNVPEPVLGARLTLTLPRGLSLTSSTPALFNNSLPIQSLAQGQSGVISLMLKADETAPATLTIRSSIANSSRTLAESASSLTIPGDALAATITTNGESDAAVQPGQLLQYILTIKNQATVPLKDVKVDVRLGGSLLDLKYVQAQGGSLAPTQPVVSWTGVGVPKLRVIEPNDTVTLQMVLRVKQQVGVVSGASSTVSMTVTSPTVPAGTSASGVIARAESKMRLAASVAFTATGYKVDPLGQIKNSGPQPPKVGVKSQYVIRWSIRPSSAALKDVVVVGKLPPGVTYTGKVVGVPSQQLSFDARTGEVTWSLAAAKANVTVVAAFQVEVTPAPNQEGRDVVLIGDSKLSATDDFTGLKVSESDSDITTALRGAPKQGSGTVVQ